jgi:hypothetical protein
LSTEGPGALEPNERSPEARKSIGGEAQKWDRATYPASLLECRQLSVFISHSSA